MAITTKNRKDLKANFVKNAIPTEQNFADLVDAQLNQSDDGVFKLAGEPFSIVSSGGGQKRVLRLYADYPAANPDWLISLNPAQNPADAATNRAGFGIADGAGNTRLFLDASGKLGLGTNEPQGNLDIRLAGTAGWNRFVVNTTNEWGDAGAQYVTIGSGGATGIMLSNPHVTWRNNQASIRYGRVGSTAGNTFWDVGVRTDGSFGFSAIDNGAGGQQVAISKAGLLTASAGLRFDGAVAHMEIDGALYRNTDGQVYLTVDDNFYFRDRDSGTGWAAHVDTNTGTINLKGAVNAQGAVNAGATSRITANGGLLNLEGTDHGYIQFYPQKLAGGRKGWIGYGSPNGLGMGVTNETGDLALYASANISINAAGGKVVAYGGLAVNDGTNSGVNRGLWLWSPGDSAHAIYSANPSGKTPANTTPPTGFHNNSHRMRFRTAGGQGFLFENSSDQVLFDIDSTTGNAWTRGAMYVGGSDIYFTQTDHNHTGVGNTSGYAAIENASNFGALMILGRNMGTPQAANRVVKLWDYLEVNGTMRITGATLQIGEWVLESAGENFVIRRGGAIVARFTSGWDKLQVYRNANGVAPYFYINGGGNFGMYNG